ncbi:BAG-associated GRAM protein 1-like [Brachypodium distachyon]|uniref:BAG-associated GRAM protein 1-like n=1 Tax=Brachypodium distachyon TaxID=15368 RepID=UPI000D0DF12B|nr:BAG-associated GRAM protein 1-like [Brachypodium distachyon]|eukprot:XP_024315732.1 BAG-associated GRAM protein 1-like [Brachypodium distachyon]
MSRLLSGCVLSRQVIIPLQDINVIKRSQHSLINPAITRYLHTGAGGHGAPPLCGQQNVTFRSPCHGPLCRIDTAVTGLQHTSFSKDKRNLIYENKAAGTHVPFGSCFEWQVWGWIMKTSTSALGCCLFIKGNVM